MKTQDGSFVVVIEELLNPVDGEDECTALDASASVEAVEVVVSPEDR
jgi:hypothetical protein